MELVADGIGVAKATGRCTEDMRSVRYGGRALVGSWSIDGVYISQQHGTADFS